MIYWPNGNLFKFSGTNRIPQSQIPTITPKTSPSPIGARGFHLDLIHQCLNRPRHSDPINRFSTIHPLDRQFFKVHNCTCKNGSRETYPAFLGLIVIHTLELVKICVYAKFEVSIHLHTLWQHERQCQMYKIGKFAHEKFAIEKRPSKTLKVMLLDRSHITYYQWPVVTTFLSCTVSEFAARALWRQR